MVLKVVPLAKLELLFLVAQANILYVCILFKF